MTAEPIQGRRRPPIWGSIVLAIGYLAIIQTVPLLTTPDGAEYGNFETVSEITRGLWVTTGLGCLIVLIAVGVLRWWRPVFVEENRLPRWVWLFPAVMLFAIVAGTAYSRLADKGLTFTILLLLGTLAVGFSEEGIFRGIGVVSFRDAGYSEPMVALWTSVLFGLAHATNLFSEGVGAIPQVLTTAIAGYFFYLARRVSGTLIFAMVLHGLWDFGLFTNTIGDDIGLGAMLFILVDIILAIIAFATIRKLFALRKTASADVPPNT